MTTSAQDPISYAEHASDIVALAARLIGEGRRFALVTSLEIEGGAARNVGSLALVDDRGQMTGYLSNGCIDRDIQFHAMEALESGARQVLRYGDGSRFADLKLPCGGALTVLIDPAPDTAALTAAAAAFAARRPVTLEFQGEDAAARFAFTYAPKYRLVLAGRGAIFRAVAQAGRSTGFEVRLMSPEDADLAAVRGLSDVAPLALTTPEAVPEFDDWLDPYSAFLTLFHDHEWEPFLLRAALQSRAAFIGSLGSRRTHMMRVETLRQMGVEEAALARLRGPIGLVPSLRDASFIAVSALAEIVATFPASVMEETPVAA